MEKLMKKALLMIAIALFAVGCSESGGTEPGTPPEPSANQSTAKPADDSGVQSGEQKEQNKVSTEMSHSSLADSVPKDGEEVGVIDTVYGKIVVRFFEDVAPNHVKNFKNLANKKFYDGTYFHRVIPGFMIQGGDPNTKDDDKSNDGTGGPGWNVMAEFNSVKHTRGILSAARSMDPNSAGSQFFLMHADSPHLDGQYSVYGQIVKSGKEKEGEESEYLKVVDKIVNLPRDSNDNPNEKATVKSIRIVKWPNI
jgi:peptidyl-prolyl cis-trans isomerase B (cyclophilin B)